MLICSVADCGLKIRCKGLCLRHYCKLLKYGDANVVLVETHGMTHTPEYRSWRSAKTRCYNSNFRDYEHYGGRGIKMCDRWLHSFESFYAYRFGGYDDPENAAYIYDQVAMQLHGDEAKLNFVW